VSTVPPVGPPVDLSDSHRVGISHWSEGDTASGGTGQTVLGVDCLATMVETYHVHPHLSIFLNGEALAIPGDIGIVESPSQCFYSIHTHDNSGRIHVEAPAPGTFTLGQLFAIWGRPLSDTNVAGLTGMPIVVYVTDNGTVTEAPADTWSSIELKSHREITIQVGTPISQIPNFTYSGD
jgi:hypothetical protein